MRDAIVFYESWHRAINTLPAKEKLKAYDAVMRYALYGEEPDIQTAAASIFIMAKPLIDKNNQNYENGKRGGRKKRAVEKTEEEPNENRNETEVEPYVNVKVNVKDNVKEKEKRKRFTPPTQQEVEAYCRERNNGVDAERFVNFYASKDWMVGSNKMKDWRAAVRTWEKSERASPKNAFNRIQNNSYDFEELERGLIGE